MCIRDRYRVVGVGACTAGALMVVATVLWLMSLGQSAEWPAHVLVFETSVMVLGLTWYKSDGDQVLIKMAELLVTVAMGLSVSSQGTLTPHMDAKEVAWCAFLVALTAVMYVAQPGIRNRKLGALAWILLGEWMLLESMFEEHHKDSDKLFGAAHWSALLCLNWVCFLFFKGDLGFERGDQIEHASLVSRPPTGGRNYTEDSRQLF
eukprot:TRINITY_DN5921_c0_g1_i4.p1 TRINITY_DN5921_c0_g1~~TRINITY_DN5921_c0_g1_i4.p1  ORF type:complete len:206 (-),score=64.02 TRINITY_DN5921_c0_g1_i4:513-1130(-)